MLFEHGPAVLIKVPALRFHHRRLNRFGRIIKGRKHDKWQRNHTDPGKNKKNLSDLLIRLFHHALSSFTAHFL
jgi:hypothetical protein